MEKELREQENDLLYLFQIKISNKGINDIIQIIKSLEHLRVLIDGFTETVKHEMKKTRRRVS